MGDSTYFLELADSYRRSGQHHKAVRLLQGILESEPSCSPGYALLAAVLTEEGRSEEALACWERVMDLDPLNEYAQVRASQLRQELADPRSRRPRLFPISGAAGHAAPEPARENAPTASPNSAAATAEPGASVPDAEPHAGTAAYRAAAGSPSAPAAEPPSAPAAGPPSAPAAGSPSAPAAESPSAPAAGSFSEPIAGRSFPAADNLPHRPAGEAAPTGEAPPASAADPAHPGSASAAHPGSASAAHPGSASAAHPGSAPAAHPGSASSAHTGSDSGAHTGSASGAQPAPAAAAVNPLTLGLADLLVGLMEFRDPYFRGGSSQARLVAGAIARQLGLDEGAVREIELAAVLRDLGQLPVKALISQVGSELTEDAKRHVERHVDVTLDLLSGMDLPQSVRDAIRYHHERWDGSGYPDALKGDAIPLSARILAVADTFAAMIAARPHRLPQRVPAALDDLKNWAGTRYDPAVVDALVHVVERGGWRGPGFGLRQHLILVDAEETRAMANAVRLCSLGYLAEAAFSADSALKRVQRSRLTRPAGFVISGDMEDGQALELLRQLRASPRTSAVPVAITAADAAQRVAYLQAGADVCVPPGSSFEELHATLDALLRRSGRMESPADSSATPANLWAGLQGDLEEFPLSWLLQVLHYDARSAGIFIVGKEDEGAIYLDRGNPRFAQTRTLTGEAAFHAMLKWPAGSFTVDPDATVDHHTISTPLMNLLLEQAVVDDHTAFFDTRRMDR